ncbi:MAG: helix-turn-helix domain-containing protein [Treponema sp.]|nr:helix-turn-helix domain-containing protein [Treponema sp.]
MKPFAERLYAEISRQELTIDKLAKKSGVSTWTILSWMKDGKTPRVDNAVAVAMVLNTTCEYLVTGEDSKL